MITALVIVGGTALALLALGGLVVAYLAALLWMIDRCERDRETAWG